MDQSTEKETIERIRSSRRRWWPVRDVAALIGKSRSQVYRYIRENKLIASKVSERDTRVYKEALVAYLKAWRN